MGGEGRGGDRGFQTFHFRYPSIPVPVSVPFYAGMGSSFLHCTVLFLYSLALYDNFCRVDENNFNALFLFFFLFFQDFLTRIEVILHGATLLEILQLNCSVCV